MLKYKTDFSIYRQNLFNIKFITTHVTMSQFEFFLIVYVRVIDEKQKTYILVFTYEMKDIFILLLKTMKIV